MATLREFQAPPGYEVMTLAGELNGEVCGISCPSFAEAKSTAAAMSEWGGEARILRDPWESKNVSRGLSTVARFVNGQQVFPLPL